MTLPDVWPASSVVIVADLQVRRTLCGLCDAQIALAVSVLDWFWIQLYHRAAAGVLELHEPGLGSFSTKSRKDEAP